MQSLVGGTLPEYDARTASVLLYSELNVTILPNGHITTLERKAFKILRPDGRDRGVVRIDYDSQVHIASLHAWCIPTDGKVYEVKDKEAADTALIGILNGELMGDLRSRLMRIPAATPGNIVGYEVARELTPYSMTDEWAFQDVIPAREVRYTLQLPPGWSYKATWLNHDEQPAVTLGPGRTQWALKDLSAIRVEQSMPPWQGVAGRLVLAFLPPPGQDPGFQTWHDMGKWYLGVARGRAQATPQIKQKVAELTASEPTKWGKIKAIANFVQSDIRYVAIELGVGSYQPHPAADVFGGRYGDCKDKATLLSAMLGEIGVNSYYVIINATRGAITESTPANLGFNHVILAIQWTPEPGDAALPALLSRPGLGKILFFDPTDEFTPLGRLSGALQANYGLLVAPDGGELVKLPLMPADLNAVQRTAKLTLDEKGTLRGDIHEVWSGDMASEQRAAQRFVAAETDRVKPVEAVAAESFATYDILKASIGNGRVLDRPFEWSYSVEVPGYARRGGDLLLVRPRVLGTKSSALLETQDPRQYPIEFPGLERDTDVFDIALPSGYVIDNLPPPVDVDNSFASYHSRTEHTAQGLRYTRTFEIKDVSVSVSNAQQLKEFYRIIGGDERMSAVLKPANP